MSSRLEIQPEIAEQLVALAKAKGISVDQLLREILATLGGIQTETTETSFEEFESDLDALAEGLENLPLQYQGTYPRADIYADHD
jgi:hypothetical protein